MNPKSLQSISYGVYIVTSGKEARCNGQIANTVVQVSSQPPTIAVSINKQNFTHEIIKETGVFAVSVLSEAAPLSFIGDFGFRCGRQVDKFERVEYKIGKTGARIVLNHAVAYFEARVIDLIDEGTHTLFIGEIVDADLLSDEIPMTYSFYHKIKRGTTPQSAPTYAQIEKKDESKNKTKYICMICNYLYDPILGDPESGVPTGTSFEELPAGWVCPICGAAKEKFEKRD
jgi:flavin reductase (DIM6/NTAB) family NADH-FMN oxidoreductase RutF/rubredoxin